ncbi:hypothetical protein J5N97_024659 [Dioscorea zingiberensis]|uniref:Cation/H(+) antiporter central domain-containing protein n=1 Tax=Dioscorea zingiberensis TaxID=325984 RepID=A0A9D5H938_9LILI|nr:hypothetical protein J5N97_024659 [Dioscorea zingiberensis]
MHDYVYLLALDKKANLIILPFHHHVAIDGTVEAVNSTTQAVNMHVLRYPPCFVRILVYRGGGGGREEMGLGCREGEEDVKKLGQVLHFRCSDTVCEGFEVENTASQSGQRSFMALGRPMSVLRTKMGSMCTQYQAPFPLITFVLTVTSPSYLLLAALAVASSLIVNQMADAPPPEIKMMSSNRKDKSVF